MDIFNRFFFFSLSILITFLTLSPTPSSGQTNTNYALSFIDTTSYASVPNTSVINTNDYGQRTIELWFNVFDKDNSQRKQVIYEEGGVINGFNIYVYDGALHLGSWSNANNYGGKWLKTNAIRNNTWHHVTLVYNKNQGEFKGFLDGTEFASEDISSSISAHSGGIGIGMVRDNTRFDDEEITGNGQAFNGYVDEFRLWNRALTETEINDKKGEELIGTERELAAYWSFNEGSGQKSQDLSINNNDVKINGAQWETRGAPVNEREISIKGNYAVNSGEDVGFVEIPNTEEISIKPQKKRTIESWFKIRSFRKSSNHQVIYEEGGTSNGYNIYVYQKDLYIGAYSEDNNWSGNWIKTNSARIDTNKWYHVALVYDKTNNEFKGYLDGSVFGTGNAPVAIANHENGAGISGINKHAKFENGEVRSEESETLKGSVDEVRIWNEARTKEQIQQNITQSLTGSEQYLVGYWPFDEGNGLITMDRSRYGNHGIFKPKGAAGFQQIGWIEPGAPKERESLSLNNLDKCSPGDLKINWIPVIGANTYRLDIATAQTESSIFDRVEVEDSSSYNYSASKLQDGKTYYLRVAASNNGGASYDTTSSFSNGITLDQTAPSANRPVGRLEGERQVQFSFSGVDNTAITKFHIQIDDDSDFSSPDTEKNIAPGQTHEFDGSFGTTYYARAKGSDCANNEGSYSRVDSVAITPLPDLNVIDIQAPETALAGNEISIEWTVENNGQGVTRSQGWKDAVYLVRNNKNGTSTRIQLGKVDNASFLKDGQQYRQKASFKIPLRWQNNRTGESIVINGPYKIMVEADFRDVESESKEHNNETNFDRNINIDLPPLPDLKVIDGIAVIPFCRAKDFIKASKKQVNKDAKKARTDKLSAVSEDIAGWQSCKSTVQYVGNERQMSQGSNLGFLYEWTVTNQGDGPTEKGWRGALLFQQGSGPFNPNEATPVTSMRTPPLASGDTATFITPYPSLYPGDFNEGHFYVVTNSQNEIFEGVADTNNIYREKTVTQLTPVPPSDLEPTNFRNPNNAESSDSIDIEWTISNNGPSKVSAGIWKDEIYLSNDDRFEPEQDTLLDEFIRESRYQNELPPGNTFTNKEKVRLPDGIEGSYHLFVDVDADDQINEKIPNQADFENNNVLRSNLLQIERADYPDLKVSKMDVPGKTTAGAGLLIQYKVTNTADSAEVGNTEWKDRIYLSRDSTFEQGSAEKLTTVEIKKQLSSQEGYQKAQNVQIPEDLSSGTYYIYVKTNVNGGIYEHGPDVNNNTSGTQIRVDKKPLPDLRVSTLGFTGNPVSGQSISIDWRVENIGETKTEATSWFDRIYLSEDTTLETIRDTELKKIVHTGRLAKGSGYNAQERVQLPGNVSGSYFLLLASDAGSEVAVQDLKPTNNSQYSSINVAVGPTPDLRIDSVSILGRPTAAQPLDMVVKVLNVGESLTSKTNWHDSWYFSKTPKLEDSEDRLVTKRRIGPLSADSSYKDTIRVTMPRNTSGSFYLLGNIDNDEQLSEGQGENNNLLATPISVTLPPPSDLIVRNVQVPKSAQPGQETTVQYEVKNIGDNEVSGRLYDAVYVSSDTTLDTADPRLKLLDRVVNIAPSQSKTIQHKVTIPDLGKSDANKAENIQSVDYDRELSAKANQTNSNLPGLLPGDYHALVWVDVRNNIRENDISNNRSASTNTFPVSVPDLTLGASKQVDFANNTQQSYFKVNVAEDKDLRFTLDNWSDGVRGQEFEMFVAYNRAPTASNFDAAYQAESGENPRVFIPGTKQGSYFVMIRNPYLSDSARIDVQAKTFDFSLFSSTPNSGGNSGSVVATLEGAQLDSTTTYSIVDGNTSIKGEIVDIPNSMKAEVRFNLRGEQLANYDIVAEKPDGSTARIKDGFEIVLPVENKLQASISVPPRIRLPKHRPISYPITVKNDNNIDHDIVVLTVLVPGDQFFKVESNDFHNALLLPNSTNIEKDSMPNTGVATQLTSKDGFKKKMGVITLIAKNVRVGETLTAQVRSPDIDNRPIGSSLTLGVHSKAYSENEFISLIESKAQDVAKGIKKLIKADTSKFFSNTAGKKYQSELGKLSRVDTKQLVNFYRDTGLFSDDSLTAVTGKSVYNPDDFKESALSTGFVSNKSVTGSTHSQPLNFNTASSGSQQCSNFATAAGFGLTVGSTVYGAGLLVGFAAGSFALAPAAVLGASLTVAGGVIFTTITIDSIVNNNDWGVTGRLGGVPTGFSPTDIGGAFATPLLDFACNLIVGAFDPNDIVGPDGVGAANWIQSRQSLPYKIRFENDPERANVPAKNVVVRQPIDQSLDIRSLRLQSFGFGQRTYQVIGSKAQVQRRIDVTDSLGVFVDFNAGLDPKSGELFFSFRSIDPATGQPPTDPSEGFLPPNDTTRIGEGFVSYTIIPFDTVKTGSKIKAQADIVFDQNTPITTPEVINTIDAEAPVSQMKQSGISQLESGQIKISWNASDPMPGSGTQKYSIYASEGSEPFKPIANDIEDTSYVYEPVDKNSESLRFFTVAEDKVGNAEDVKKKSEFPVALSDEETAKAEIPEKFELYHNYPNPFNPTTNIKYDLPDKSQVKLVIYNILGQRVQTLVNKKQQPGTHTVRFEPQRLASGVYIYRLEAGNHIQIKKMLYIK